MEALVLLPILATSILIAFVTAKGILSVIFHLMAGKGLAFGLRGKPTGDLSAETA
jgi:hypothetical protein